MHAISQVAITQLDGREDDVIAVTSLLHDGAHFVGLSRHDGARHKGVAKVVGFATNQARRDHHGAVAALLDPAPA